MTVSILSPSVTVSTSEEFVLKGFVGQEDKAKKLKNLYVSDNGVARSCRGVFVGVDDVAKKSAYIKINPSFGISASNGYPLKADLTYARSGATPFSSYYVAWFNSTTNCIDIYNHSSKTFITTNTVTVNYGSYVNVSFNNKAVFLGQNDKMSSASSRDSIYVNSSGTVGYLSAPYTNYFFYKTTSLTSSRCAITCCDDVTYNWSTGNMGCLLNSNLTFTSVVKDGVNGGFPLHGNVNNSYALIGTYNNYSAEANGYGFVYLNTSGTISHTSQVSNRDLWYDSSVSCNGVFFGLCGTNTYYDDSYRVNSSLTVSDCSYRLPVYGSHDIRYNYSKKGAPFSYFQANYTKGIVVGHQTSDRPWYGGFIIEVTSAGTFTNHSGLLFATSSNGNKTFDDVCEICSSGVFVSAWQSVKPYINFIKVS